MSDGEKADPPCMTVPKENKNSPFRLIVTEIKVIGPQILLIKLVSNTKIFFRAGQYLSMVIPPSPENPNPLSRSFSIASAPEDQAIEICVKIGLQNANSHFYESLRPGSRIFAQGPNGDLVYQTPSSRSAFFIGTSTSISPFKSILSSSEFRENKPRSAQMIMAAATKDSLIFQDYFHGLPWLKFVPVVENEDVESGFRGRPTDYLRMITDRIPWDQTDFYLCGSFQMIAELEKILLAKGVQDKSIFVESHYREWKASQTKLKNAG